MHGRVSAYGLGRSQSSSAVTIRPVDGGFIVEWVELKERTVPGHMLGSTEESWKHGDRKVKIPIMRQAVREKLEAALELVEKVVKGNIELLKKGGDEDLDVDLSELA